MGVKPEGSFTPFEATEGTGAADGRPGLTKSIRRLVTGL